MPHPPVRLEEVCGSTPRTGVPDLVLFSRTEDRRRRRVRVHYTCCTTAQECSTDTQSGPATEVSSTCSSRSTRGCCAGWGRGRRQSTPSWRGGAVPVRGRGRFRVGLLRPAPNNGTFNTCSSPARPLRSRDAPGGGQAWCTGTASSCAWLAGGGAPAAWGAPHSATGSSRPDRHHPSHHRVHGFQQTALNAVGALRSSCCCGGVRPQDRNAVRWFLRHRIMAWLGIVSYAIYLWHHACSMVRGGRNLPPFHGELRPCSRRGVLTVPTAAQWYCREARPAPKRTTLRFRRRARRPSRPPRGVPRS